MKEIVASPQDSMAHIDSLGKGPPQSPVHKSAWKSCDKHPSPLQGLSEQEIKKTLDLLGITGTRLRSILRKTPKLKRDGPDKLRNEHLRTLIGFGGKQAPDEDEFAHLLADILVLLVKSQEHLRPTPSKDVGSNSRLLALVPEEPAVRVFFVISLG